MPQVSPHAVFNPSCCDLMHTHALSLTALLCTFVHCAADDEEGLQQSLLRLRGMGGATTIAIRSRCAHGQQDEDSGDRAAPNNSTSRGSGSSSGSGNKSSGGSPAGQRQVLGIVSDSGASGQHTARQGGVRGQATAQELGGGMGLGGCGVGSGRLRFRGADVVLEWEAVAGGEYDARAAMMGNSE